MLVILHATQRHLDWVIAGSSIRQRMHAALSAVSPAFTTVECEPGSSRPNGLPTDDGFIWIEGAFPFLTPAAIKSIMTSSKGYARAPRAPHLGLLHAADGSLTSFEFERATAGLEQNAEVDPIAMQPVLDGASYAVCQEFAFERIRQRHLERGVLFDAVETVWIDDDVQIAGDVHIEANVHLRGRTNIRAQSRIGVGSVIQSTSIAEQVVIRPYCVIQDATIEAAACIGPFAHIRPKSRIGQQAQVGNFVETKNTHLGNASKANHLSYLGDAEIGRDCNIGAGTITCNYDGVNKNTSTLGDRVFVGSDSQLVAPLHLHDDSYIAAGTTVTRDVEAGSLAIGRPRQTNKAGWTEHLRERAEQRRQERLKQGSDQ